MEKEPICGALQKRGNIGVGGYVWRHRYFVLENNVLSYYDSSDVYSRNPKAIKGKILLEEAVHIRGSPEARYGEGTIWASGQYFQIEMSDRTYYLYANSKKDANEWIKNLNLSKQVYEQLDKQSTNSVYSEFHSFAKSDFSPDQSYSSPDTFNNKNAHNNVKPSPSNFNNNFSSPNNDFNSMSGPPLQQESRALRSSGPEIGFLMTYAKSYRFTEGQALQDYIQFFDDCCEKLSQESQTNASEWKCGWKVMNAANFSVFLYLALQLLHLDTREAMARLGRDFSAFEPLVLQAAEAARNTLLHVLTMDGPTLVTQIDTWTKRTRTPAQLTFLKGDYEAVVGYNLVIFQHVLSNFGVQGAETELVYTPLFQLCSELLGSLRNEPMAFYSAQLWNSLNTTAISQPEKKIFRNFLHVSLIFQKIRLDQKNLKFADLFNKVDEQFERALIEFSQATRRYHPYQMHMQEIRGIEIQIFSKWTTPLLPSDDTKRMLLQLMALLKRLAVMLDKANFAKLQDSLFTAAIMIENFV